MIVRNQRPWPDMLRTARFNVPILLSQCELVVILAHDSICLSCPFLGTTEGCILPLRLSSDKMRLDSACLNAHGSGMAIEFIEEKMVPVTRRLTVTSEET